MRTEKAKTFTMKVYCSNCNYCLYKYKKVGVGHLLKCYKDRILRDNTKGDLKCPKCQQVFAREAIIHKKPANKIIQGKVYVKK